MYVKVNDYLVQHTCMFACSDVPQVDKYLKEILKDVISNLTSNTWRVRESRYSNSTRSKCQIKS